MIDPFAAKPNVPAPVVAPDPMVAVLAALDQLRAAIADMPAPPAPVVNVAPVDLSEIVQAVTSLQGPATAEEIAAALAMVLAPTRTDDPALGAVLAEVAAGLKKLDFRLQGVGTQAYGGGSVSIDATTLSRLAAALTGLTDSQLRASAVPVSQLQIADAANSATRTAADGATAFNGSFSPTRSRGVVRVLTTLASNVTSGLGGTFVFRFSEDGATATITETRTINDFATVRDFSLENVGAYYDCSFTPSRALTGGEQVFIATQFNTQFPGFFTRLADQELEQDNAAMQQGFAYAKAFDPFTRRSVNLRPQVSSTVPTPTQSNLAGGGVYLTDALDTLGFSSAKVVVVTNVISASLGVKFEWSDTSAFTVTRLTESFSLSSGDVSAGYATFDAVTKERYLRIRYTNGASAQGTFYVNLVFNSFPFLADVSLRSSAAGNTGQQDVTTGAGTVASPALVARKSIRLTNMVGSARPLYYGFTAGLTAANGDELSAGVSVDLDCDESVSLYVICTSTGGAGVRCAWTELA